jgi:hypothetical protein
VGCIAGAVLKDDYLGAIGNAGFEDVKIMDETLFPVKDFIDHPAVQDAVGDSAITKEKVEDLSSAVASIKVYAVKPAK